MAVYVLVVAKGVEHVEKFVVEAWTVLATWFATVLA
jgi:hypothetical protein